MDKNTIGGTVNVEVQLEKEMEQESRNESSLKVQEKEPELDDVFERRKLASLHSLMEHQKRIERELPVYAERNKEGNKLKKHINYEDESDLERHFELMQKKREMEIIKRKRDLIKAHEVEIMSIQCMDIFDDKESSVTEVIDAFCSYKMFR